jgi:hypothetical protein
VSNKYVCKYCGTEHPDAASRDKCCVTDRPGIRPVNYDKKMLKDAELRYFLSSETPSYQGIGAGVHNGCLYYGMKIFKDGEYFDAIVASNRKIYIATKSCNEIKEAFGLNYRYPFYSEILDYNWSITGQYGVRAYLWEPKMLMGITLKGCYEAVIELLRWKWWTPIQQLYKHHALTILGTYEFPTFEMFGRESIYGEPGWGKTRLSKIYQQLAFHPCMSANFSDSSIFRSIESVKPTTIIDNFDSIREDKQAAGKIIHLYNTGCYAKQKVMRSEGKSFKPTGFNIFSPMVLNSINPLDAVAESRSNITRTIKTTKAEFAKLEVNNLRWAEARDMFYCMGLKCYQDIAETYSRLKEDALVSRELERVAPQLTLAKLIDKNLYDEMLEFYIQQTAQREQRDWDDEWGYNAIGYVVKRLNNDNLNEIELKTKDVVEEIAPKLLDTNSKNYDSRKHGMTIVLGGMFANSILFPSRQTGGHKLYKFTRENLRLFATLKGYGKDFLDLIGQERLPDPTDPTNPTDTTNHTDPTNPPTNTTNPITKKGSPTMEGVGSVGSVGSSKDYPPIRLKFKTPTPKFQGADGKAYGPYKLGDTAKLPREEAQLLIKRGIAEEVTP